METLDWQDGSVGNSACSQAGQPEFSLWDPHGGQKKYKLASDLYAFIMAPMYPSASPHTHKCYLKICFEIGILCVALAVLELAL